MATPVLLPKLGNSVESSIIVGWLKQPGDVIAEGDALCAVETDKATVEVPSPIAGVLLQQLANAGDDVPVQTPIALIGAASEASNALAQPSAISPRAQKLAQEKGVDVSGIAGSGPRGRIIERDVVNALAQQEPVAAKENITPVAKAMLVQGGFVAPAQGSGPGGRITKSDLIPASEKGSERFERSDPFHALRPFARLRRDPPAQHPPRDRRAHARLAAQHGAVDDECERRRARTTRLPQAAEGERWRARFAEHHDQ